MTDLDKKFLAKGRPYKVRIGSLEPFYFRSPNEVGPFMRTMYPNERMTEVTVLKEEDNAEDRS